jgi:hypothetical protein
MSYVTSYDAFAAGFLPLTAVLNQEIWGWAAAGGPTFSGVTAIPEQKTYKFIPPPYNTN